LAANYVLQRTPGTFRVSSKLRDQAPLNTALGCTEGNLMLRIELDDLSRPQVLALLQEHLRNMYELSPPDKVFAFDARRLRAPNVTFWTAWNHELLMGCAALKEISPTEGEIKSMRTPSALRRSGVGRALLNHVIEVGRSRAYHVIYLETGPNSAFAPAQALYRSAGFELCGPFGSYQENGNSVFMSLWLT
jgi:putative acetyltransferase